MKDNKKKNSPTLYLLAGPNGAGKTTLAKIFLPEFINCQEFVNADFLALGLAPLSPERMAIKAGRLMLDRINELSRQKITFTIETTLAGKTYVNTIKKLKLLGYRIDITFLWLPSYQMAVKRVQQRVAKGGHSIPKDVVKRRFNSGLLNLLSTYSKLSDRWRIFDAATAPPELILEGTAKNHNIFNKNKADFIFKSYEKKKDQ